MKFGNVRIGEEFEWDKDPDVYLTKIKGGKASRFDKNTGELRGTTPVPSNAPVTKK